MDESSPEPPQQIMLLKKHEPEKLLQDLSVCLGCDLESNLIWTDKVLTRAIPLVILLVFNGGAIVWRILRQLYQLKSQFLNR